VDERPDRGPDRFRYKKEHLSNHRCVLEIGASVEVRRNGRTLRMVRVKPPARLERLKRRRDLLVDPESIVRLDLSEVSRY